MSQARALGKREIQRGTASTKTWWGGVAGMFTEV